MPDSVALFRRLLSDDRGRRRRKLPLAAMIGYLALPLDLVPDFIPVADDAIIVALVLRAVLRASGPQLLREHLARPAVVAQRAHTDGLRQAPAGRLTGVVDQREDADQTLLGSVGDTRYRRCAQRSSRIRHDRA